MEDMGMTLEEMEAKARELFGLEAEVFFSDGQWMIATAVKEKFDPEEHKDRRAYEAYHDYEENYGSTLLRWAYKNGMGGRSMAEIFDEYDDAQERAMRKSVESVRRSIALGRSFDWEGGEEYRDRVLAYAEEKGL